MEEIQKGLKFIRVASKTCEEAGQTYNFVCPVCEGKAKVSRDSKNGRMHAYCTDCGTRVHV